MRDRDRQQRDRLLLRVIARGRRAPGPRRSRRAPVVAEIGAGSVTARVTERRSAKRTRTVMVRPARDLARSLAPMRSARWWSVGLKTRSIGGSSSQRRLRAGRVRAPALSGSSRGSRFHASAVSFRPAACPSSSLHALRRALRQLTDGGDADLGEPRLGGGTDAPHQRDGQVVQELELGRPDRRPPAHRAWRPARRSSRGAWCAPRRSRSAGRARRAPAPGPSARSRPASRRDACTRRRRRRPRRWRCARRRA